MDAAQIDSILTGDKHVKKMNYLGVYPADEIPEHAIDAYPCCAVVNTKPHNHPGMHWVCFVKDEKNNGTYFDSYGTGPGNFEEMSVVLESCHQLEFNDTQLQTPFSAVCGQYCIFFIIHKARGFSLQQIVDMVYDSGDTYASDASVYSYIQNRYADEIFKATKPPLMATSFILTDVENI